jgi:16S rRNA (uracil1498-N3)-methyltransferase
MKNIPRIFIDQKLTVGETVPLSRETLHYLEKVMRTDKFLAFNNGTEFECEISGKSALVLGKTDHADPSNDIILGFAPIKQSRLEEMLSMATQMGVARLLPVTTDYTNAKHTNWERIRRMIIEAAEQSGRNSTPELMPEIKFDEFVKNYQNIIFADERFAHDSKGSDNSTLHTSHSTLLIGPEGGFSDKEFAALDAIGAKGISLGKTILRAETAAVAAIAKIC